MKELRWNCGRHNPKLIKNRAMYTHQHQISFATLLSSRIKVGTTLAGIPRSRGNLMPFLNVPTQSLKVFRGVPEE